MASVRVTLAELQADPVAAYRAGGGAPVGVELDGVILFFLSSAVDTLQPKVPAREPVVAAVATSADPAASYPINATATNRKPIDCLANDNDTVNLSQAAELLGKSKSTISRAVSDERLPVVPEKNSYRIKLTDLANVFDMPQLLAN